MYNILQPSCPQRVFQLDSLSKPKGRGFYLQDEDPVGFVICDGAGVWGAFCVMIVTSSGDVYSLCPVMPHQCRLSMKHFVGLEEDVADGENQFAHSLVAQFKATRTQWPKVGENSEANDCHVHVAVGEEFDGVSMPLPLFGPYRIHPDPNCNPKFERKALGIWKKMMENVFLLMIGYSDGTIDALCLLDSPQLNIDGTAGVSTVDSAVKGGKRLTRRRPPTLSLYVWETWQISDTFLSFLHIQQSSRNPHRLYAVSSAGVCSILLSKNFEPNVLDSLLVVDATADGAKKLPTSSADPLKNTAIQLIELPEHILIFLPRLEKPVQLAHPHSPAIFNSTHAPTTLLRSLPIDEYITRDSVPIRVPIIPTLLTSSGAQDGKHQNASNASTFVYPQLTSSTNAQSCLATTWNVVERYRECVQEIRVGWEMLLERLSVLELEVERMQQVKLPEITLNEMPRVQRLQERQNRLKERADAALLMAMEFYQPQLSPVELQWLDEVALMKFEVSRMQKKCEQLFITLDYLTSTFEVTKTNAKLGDQQQQSVTVLLTQTGEMMNHVERKLKVLELHLDSE